MKRTSIPTILALVAGVFAGSAAAQGSQPPEKLLEALKTYQNNEMAVEKRLEIFRQLDLEIYSTQQWDRIGESHAKDILVHYPDGSTTKGLPDHIAEMKKLFAFAPDTRVEGHPVKFGSGEWTAAISNVTGTFTKPMPIGNGKVIQPTGKAFKYQVATIARWNKDNLMVEEFLFWDSQEFSRQLGLGK